MQLRTNKHRYYLKYSLYIEICFHKFKQALELFARPSNRCWEVNRRSENYSPMRIEPSLSRSLALSLSLYDDKDCLPFLRHNVLQPRYDLLGRQGTKPELGAAGLQCRDDFTQVIANDAEPHVIGVLLDN